MSSEMAENMRRARRDRLRATIGREPTDQEVRADFDNEWVRAIKNLGSPPAVKVTC